VKASGQSLGKTVISAARKPAIIGIDEVSLRKGHAYRIVVSDLVRRRLDPGRPLPFPRKDDRHYVWADGTEKRLLISNHHR